MGVSIIVVVGTLTLYALLHSECALNDVQMNVPRSPIWEFMFMGSNRALTVQKQSNTFWVRIVKLQVDHSRVRNFIPVARTTIGNTISSGMPETVDSEGLLQARVKNPWSSIRRVSGEFGISQSSVSRHIHM